MASKTLILLAVLLIPLLCACRTSQGSDHDQIVKAAIDLADAYMAAGDYQSALSVYDRALTQADDYRLLYNKAIVLSALELDYEAVVLCREGYEKYPHILSFKRAQAVYSRRANSTQDCYDAYETLLALNPYDTATRKEYIDVLNEDGQNLIAYDQALILWNQGYHDRDTVTYLYNLKAPEWENVYLQITGPKPDVSETPEAEEEIASEIE